MCLIRCRWVSFWGRFGGRGRKAKRDGNTPTGPGQAPFTEIGTQRKAREKQRGTVTPRPGRGRRRSQRLEHREHRERQEKGKGKAKRGTFLGTDALHGYEWFRGGSAYEIANLAERECPALGGRVTGVGKRGGGAGRGSDEDVYGERTCARESGN